MTNSSVAPDTFAQVKSQEIVNVASAQANKMIEEARNAAAKVQVKWLPQNYGLNVTSSGLYRIHAFDQQVDAGEDVVHVRAAHVAPHRLGKRRPDPVGTVADHGNHGNGAGFAGGSDGHVGAGLPATTYRIRYAEAPGTLSSAAEISPPAELSATATLSPRCFSNNWLLSYQKV